MLTPRLRKPGFMLEYLVVIPRRNRAIENPLKQDKFKRIECQNSSSEMLTRDSLGIATPTHPL